jgi:hypothetical protein
MPCATYEELLIETVPEVIETEAQYNRIARRFGDLVGRGRVRSAGYASSVQWRALAPIAPFGPPGARGAPSGAR